MSSIDLYIAKFPAEIQQRLTAIRQTAFNIFSDIDEKLHYSLPAFSKNGKVFMFYAAYKDHISICVGEDWIDILKNIYPDFRYTQATITFAHDTPFPLDMVQTICELVNSTL
jgi:Uncharacterized conserved protein